MRNEAIGKKGRERGRKRRLLWYWLACAALGAAAARATGGAGATAGCLAATGGLGFCRSAGGETREGGGLLVGKKERGKRSNGRGRRRGKGREDQNEREKRRRGGGQLPEKGETRRRQRENEEKRGRTTGRENGGGKRSVAAYDGGVFAGAHREREGGDSRFWRREGEERE
ncbi:dehydrin Rab18-like [Solanum pennellii]|uniref:Dehydrin Rab18-like n=1 Tax=Solanum pennellii TaxID=28526 RepID=A0ABM1GQB3_SOLPN|nr:dehydrin Rab18-like [Solanum pennellii]